MKRIKIYDIVVLAVIALTIVTIVMSFHPAFFKISFNDESYSPLTKYVYIFAIMSFLLNVRDIKSLNHSFCKTYCICLGMVVLVGIILMAFSINDKYIHTIRQLIIPFLFFLTGYSAKLGTHHVRLLVYLYIFIVLYMGLSQVITNIGGFVIMDQYMVSAKNRIACIISVATIMSLYYALDEKLKMVRKTFLFIISLLLFLILLTIRGRTGIITTALIAFIMVLKYVKTRNLRIDRFIFIVAISSIVMILLFLLCRDLMSSVFDYIYNSLFAHHEGDLTNGRMSRNIEAISVFLDHPFWGRLGTDINIPWVHNYVLLVLSSYGLVCGGALIFLYAYILVDVIIRFCHNKWSECFECFPLMALFVVSLAEPTLPYGPGTIVFFPYFLYGYNKKNYSK